MSTVTVTVPVGEETVQCVSCGAVKTYPLEAPCTSLVFNERECGGEEFIALHQVHWPKKLEPAPLKYHYQRVLKSRGWDPCHAEDELLRVIRNELHKNKPCMGYLQEKVDSMLNHVRKGLIRD